jgi:hypothetical protein
VMEEIPEIVMEHSIMSAERSVDSGIDVAAKSTRLDIRFSSISRTLHVTPPAKCVRKFRAEKSQPDDHQTNSHDEPKAKRNKNPNLIDCVIPPPKPPFS